MVCDEIARRLPSKAAQSVEEPGRRFEGHICSRQSGVKILTFGPFSFSSKAAGRCRRPLPFALLPVAFRPLFGSLCAR